MTGAPVPGTEVERDFDEPVEVGFDALDLLTDDGVELFVLSLNERAAPPPYYVTAEGRRFHYSGETFLLQGRGAELPRYVAAREEEGVLVLLVERFDRYLAYIHDPAEEAEDDDEADEAEAGAEAGES